MTQIYTLPRLLGGGQKGNKGTNESQHRQQIKRIKRKKIAKADRKRNQK